MKGVFPILLIFLLFISCSPRKKIVYFQNIDETVTQGNYTPILKKDDLLSILISSDNPENVISFNLPEERSTLNNGYSTGAPERRGYLIDEHGKVNLPIIGSVELAGLTRVEAVSLLQNILSEYINNPVVNIQILNFKVTVLGDVSKPGTFKIPNERITILEAIGLAGDNTITAIRDNILVIRDNNGKKEHYRMDFTDSKSVFSSPAYYLEQNDVVYVEPNVAKRSTGAFWRTSGSIFISVVGITISTINTFSK